MPGFFSPRKGVPLLLIPEYSGINKDQRVPDRSKTAHRKPLVKCFLIVTHSFLLKPKLRPHLTVAHSKFCLHPGVLSIPGFKSSDHHCSPLHFYPQGLPISTYAIHFLTLILDFVTA